MYISYIYNNQTDAFTAEVTLRIHSKKDRTEVTAFLGEGIFTMGCSKNHIMYWGVFTLIIIA